MHVLVADGVEAIWLWLTAPLRKVLTDAMREALTEFSVLEDPIIDEYV